MTAVHPETQILQTYGATIASALVGAPFTSGRMDVTVLKRSSSAVVMRIEAEEKSCFAKAFFSDTKAQNDGFSQEHACLSALIDTPLAPRILKAMPDARCILTEPVDGRPLRDVLTQNNLPNYARQLGLWLRAFYEEMPKEKVEGNWWGYLSKLDKGAFAQAFEPHRDMLTAQPLQRVVIARNDGHLSNFHVTERAELIGIDFANAQVRPMGWDLLLTARSLARMFPGQTRSFVPDLMDGWAGSKSGKRILPDPRVVQVFAEVTAFPG